MVKKIVGLNDKDEVVFERDARAYDKGIANSMFGITIGDALKAGSVLALGIMLYANQLNFNNTVMKSLASNSDAIGDIRSTLDNLNNYLSSSTGKQFEKGRPR